MFIVHFCIFQRPCSDLSHTPLYKLTCCIHTYSYNTDEDVTVRLRIFQLTFTQYTP